jgi:putative phosphoserine phosphatase/1-acylglycerol-3-phosphate O-acyltransferase
METTFSNNFTSNNYVAFFDLDRTIIKTNSGKTLILQAYNNKLLTKNDLLKGIYLSILYKLELRNTTRIINSMVSWMKGISLKQMNDLSEEFFKTKILQSIYDEAIPEINFHKQKGARVVILSSAILPVCKIVADHLKLDDIICSVLETENGVYTGRPEGRLCFGEEKRVKLLSYCSKNNLKPSDSWYYGDSIADFPALSSVGFPVCVNPDRKLKKAAIKNDWKVLLWE